MSNDGTPRCDGCTKPACTSNNFFCCVEESNRRTAKTAALAAEWMQRGWAVGEMPRYDAV